MDDHKNSQFIPHEAAFHANPYHNAKRGSAYQGFKPKGHKVTKLDIFCLAVVGVALAVLVVLPPLGNGW